MNIKPPSKAQIYRGLATRLEAHSFELTHGVLVCETMRDAAEALREAANAIEQGGQK